MTAVMDPGDALSPIMVFTVASTTPARAPFHPTWAIATTPAWGSANRTGAQSAVRMPSTTPGDPVTNNAELMLHNEWEQNASEEEVKKHNPYMFKATDGVMRDMRYTAPERFPKDEKDEGRL